jgi:hypothetical protein
VSFSAHTNGGAAHADDFSNGAPSATYRFSTALLSDFARSDLDASDAELMQVEELTGAQCKELGAQWRRGYKIKYFDLDGTPNGRYRIRYLDNGPIELTGGFKTANGDTAKIKKPPRYWAPKGSSPDLYLAPHLDWRQIARTKRPLLISEGAKKSTRACKAGIPCIGLEGVWSFKSAKSGQLDLLKAFDHFDLEDRDITLVFDSNVMTKAPVLAALHEFARQLAKRGAKPSTVILPDLLFDEEGNPTSTGIDDIIKLKGVDYFNALLRERREDFAEIKELWKLNRQYAVFGDPAAVYDFQTEKFHTAQTFTKLVVADRQIIRTNTKGIKVPVPAGPYWLAWPQRRKYTRLAYEPGQLRDLENGSYNLWKGFGVESIKGDPSPWLWWLDHVFDGKSDAERRWFEQWVAYPIVHPGVKLFSAVVFFGEVQGSGKSFGGEILRRIYGLHNSSEIGGNAQVTGNFNSHLVNRQFILANEIADRKDMRLDSTKLKALITQDFAQLEKKFQDKIEIRDCANWWFTSNHKSAIYVDDHDRRYFFIEVGRKLPPRVIEALRAFKFDPAGIGCSAIRYHIESTADFTGFEPHSEAYHTRDRDEVIDAGRSELDQWSHDLKADPYNFLRLGNPAFKPRDLYTLEELTSACRVGHGNSVSQVALAKAMARAGIQRTTDRASTKRGRLRFWIVNHADRWISASPEDVAKEYDACLPEGAKDQKY